MTRLTPPLQPVTLTLDGEPVEAERGEPVAVSLLASGVVTLARSPKFHRPRGPACLRAACDGCLARVNGRPNVMTCRVPAEEGLRVETQNVVGDRETDLLRVTDWMFPEGMNHHELFAGVPGASGLVQSVARRVAGLGLLPDLASGGAAPRAPKARRRSVDVLVVGAGPAGLFAALELSARGRSVEVLDDDLSWGGSARALAGAAARPWRPLFEAVDAAVAASRLAIRLRTTAAALYGDDVLVADRARVEVVTAETLVLAPGAHDGVLAFEGNDLPGVLSGRAAARLAASGVSLGKRPVVVVPAGGGFFATALQESHPGVEAVAGTPMRVSGTSRPRAVTVATRAGERTLRCDVVAVDAPGSPAYELCAQAGAALVHEVAGFRVVTDEAGRIRPGVFACGEVAGTPLDPATLRGRARALAEAV